MRRVIPIAARREKVITAMRLGSIATARIELKDTDPPIWREVEVPISI